MADVSKKEIEELTLNKYMCSSLYKLLSMPLMSTLTMRFRSRGFEFK